MTKTLFCSCSWCEREAWGFDTRCDACVEAGCPTSETDTAEMMRWRTHAAIDALEEVGRLDLLPTWVERGYIGVRAVMDEDEASRAGFEHACSRER